MASFTNSSSSSTAASAAAVPRKTGGIRQRKELDLDAMVETGSEGAYEALQLYRSRAMRFQSKNEIMNAIVAASHGAIVLLINKYVTAGFELATMTIDIINEAGTEINPQVRQIIFDVDNAFPTALEHASHPQQKIDFLKACVKSTIANGQREHGEPQMHNRLALCLWSTVVATTKRHEAKLFATSMSHFALGEEPEQLAQQIDNYFGSDRAHILERDRALTLGVLNSWPSRTLEMPTSYINYSLKRARAEARLSTPSSSPSATTCCRPVDGTRPTSSKSWSLRTAPISLSTRSVRRYCGGL
jgi:hypothetical protein